MAPASGSSLTKAQSTSLRALVDALLPPLPLPASEVSNDATKRYWEYRLSSDAAFVASLEQSITQKLNESEITQTRYILSLLSSPLGTSLLFGTPSIHSFAEWPLPRRTEMLRSLQHSSIQTKRQIFNGFKRLICGLAYSYTVAGRNPFWEAMGYPGAPQQSRLTASQDVTRTFAAMEEQLDVQQSLIRIKEDTELECDILVVGSGAGGCVAASVLAQAGYNVLVVEKGPYLSPAKISNLEADAFNRMYESHGLLTTSDGAIMVLAGSTVGGGTTVNWCACLPLPEHVREEWAITYELDDFRAGAAYEKSLRHIMWKVGALDRSGIIHNPTNRKLQAGADGMGYPWDTVGQNLRDTEDPNAGYVCFGDRYWLKNGGISVFLRDAVKNGTRIVDQCQVERIIQTTDEPFPRATGAQCQVGSRKVMISARKSVIVAAGALHTPCLLQRSGLKNRHIGRHLHLHPTTAVVGIMRPSERIDCFLGAPLTTVCNEFELGPQGNGYGAKIECPSAHTGLLAAGLPWTSPAQFKGRLRQLRQGVPYIVIQRDSGEGTVCLSKDGVTPKVDYVVSKADKESMGQAVSGALQMLITTGAREVSSGHIRDPGLKLTDGPYGLVRMVSDKRVQSYLSDVSNQGMKEHEISLFSAHQMGSCRMSTSPLLGAVDTNGEAWDCNNLFVMDASTFPTASGANPMITVLTIASMLSKRLALRLRHQDQRITDSSQISRAQELEAKRDLMRSYRPGARTVSMTRKQKMLRSGQAFNAKLPSVSDISAKLPSASDVLRSNVLFWTAVLVTFAFVTVLLSLLWKSNAAAATKAAEVVVTPTTPEPSSVLSDLAAKLAEKLNPNSPLLWTAVFLPIMAIAGV